MDKNWPGANALTGGEEENGTGLDTDWEVMMSLPNKHCSGLDTARPQRMKVTKEQMENRSGERNVLDRLEKDGNIT